MRYLDESMERLSTGERTRGANNGMTSVGIPNNNASPIGWPNTNQSTRVGSIGNAIHILITVTLERRT